MENEIIIVKQLPIIVEQLKGVKQQFEGGVASALAMECNEDTYKEVKAVRANMTKVYESLEVKRKEAKRQILEPYDNFEMVYKECITSVYAPAKKQLDKKIAEVEDGLKDKIRAVALAYYNEYISTTSIDFITFESIGLNITMNASKKGLNEQIKTYIDKISDDLAMIETQEYKAEIMVEYKNSLNVSQAILTINNRHKAIDAERQRAEQAKAAAEIQAVVVQKVDEAIISETPVFAAPSVIQSSEPEEKYSMTLTVRGSLLKMKEFKQFLINGGYEYEQHK